MNEYLCLLTKMFLGHWRCYGAIFIVAENTFWSLFNTTSVEQQHIRNVVPRSHPEICTSIALFWLIDEIVIIQLAPLCVQAWTRHHRGRRKPKCLQTREFKYSTNRNKPFILLHMLCVHLCVEGAARSQLLERGQRHVDVHSPPGYCASHTTGSKLSTRSKPSPDSKHVHMLALIHTWACSLTFVPHFLS